MDYYDKTCASCRPREYWDYEAHVVEWGNQVRKDNLVEQQQMMSIEGSSSNCDSVEVVEHCRTAEGFIQWITPEDVHSCRKVGVQGQG